MEQKVAQIQDRTARSFWEHWRTPISELWLTRTVSKYQYRGVIAQVELGSGEVTCT